MSIKAILEAMVLLIQQHKELNELSSQKMELIKANDMEQLSELLKNESKLIRVIEETERTRQEKMSVFFKERNIGETEGTVSNLAKHLPAEHQGPLFKLQENLLQEMARLRQTEALNRRLLEDSLHFVQLTLDMIQPDPDAVHYSHPDRKEGKHPEGYSIFDSKA
ncbi:flagellar protein FlgN [Bacillus piscicola]|uniref:flagellar protein FlgN n=1 Tax=Bacillus piscicola TaxID=1632684 RepID=UPI001F096F1A|nr:flagellar protein FlgN [Bacillus piscicola]